MTDAQAGGKKGRATVDHLLAFKEAVNVARTQLEQLERLPPRHYPYYWPVRFESQVHTIDQYISDPKSKEGESRKNKKICKKIYFRMLL